VFDDFKVWTTIAAYVGGLISALISLIWWVSRKLQKSEKLESELIEVNTTVNRHAVQIRALEDSDLKREQVIISLNNSIGRIEKNIEKIVDKLD